MSYDWRPPSRCGSQCPAAPRLCAGIAAASSSAGSAARSHAPAHRKIPRSPQETCWKCAETHVSATVFQRFPHLLDAQLRLGRPQRGVESQAVCREARARSCGQPPWRSAGPAAPPPPPAAPGPSCPSLRPWHQPSRARMSWAKASPHNLKALSEGAPASLPAAQDSRPGAVAQAAWRPHQDELVQAIALLTQHAQRQEMPFGLLWEARLGLGDWEPSRCSRKTNLEARNSTSIKADHPRAINLQLLAGFSIKRGSHRAPAGRPSTHRPFLDLPEAYTTNSMHGLGRWQGRGCSGNRDL